MTGSLLGRSILPILLALALPASLAAQEAAPAGTATAEPQNVSPAPRQSIGLRGFAAFDMTRMTASRTFDAVLGTSDLNSFGAGVELLRLWRSAFARVGFSRVSRDGGRVIVLDDEVTPVGVPTTIRMMPLEIAGGWRFATPGRLVPYVGAGLVRIVYDETTDFDGARDDTSAAFSGSVVFGGVDFRLAGPLGLGAELQHRRLPNALGAAGASAAYGEDDLGGLTVRFWVGVGR